MRPSLPLLTLFAASACAMPQLKPAAETSFSARAISNFLHWFNIMPGSKLTPNSFILFDPSNAGSGPYPAAARNHSSLPRHVIYSPLEPSKERLPVILWGNGGCLGVGTMFSEFLKEVASHGFMVLANGYFLTDLPNVPEGQMKGDYKNNPLASLFDSANASSTTLDNFLAAGMTNSEWQMEALRWATNGGAKGIFGIPDASQVAVAGQSCGGMQAYEVTAKEPRIKATALFNSGTLMGGRSQLKKFMYPVGIFNGGPKDIAYANGEQDFKEFPPALPVVKANYDAGHLGTFFAKDGGPFSKIAVAFFKATLKDDVEAQTALRSNTSVETTGWLVDTKNWY